MKMVKFNIIKKNRVYFACESSTGFKFNLVIDENSKDLTIGEHNLLLDDISVSTKYGTDYKYKMHADVQAMTDAGVITFSHHSYNQTLVEKCRKLGGKWDADQKIWVFSGLVSDQIEQLEQEYNEDVKHYKVTLLHDGRAHTAAYKIAGYKVAQAYNRDDGATLVAGIIMTEGSIYSGGSLKNWVTCVSEGTTFILKLSKHQVEKLDKELYNVEEV